MVAEGVLAQRVRRFGRHEGGMAGGAEEVIEEEHGPQEGGVKAGEPALAEGLEAGPAIVRAQDDAEEVADLLVEVSRWFWGCVRARTGELGQPAEPVGAEPEGDGLAGAGRQGDEGEAPFVGEALLRASFTKRTSPHYS
jgi:hypothetical protein